MDSGTIHRINLEDRKYYWWAQILVAIIALLPTSIAVYQFLGANAKTVEAVLVATIVFVLARGFLWFGLKYSLH